MYRQYLLDNNILAISDTNPHIFGDGSDVSPNFISKRFKEENGLRRSRRIRKRNRMGKMMRYRNRKKMTMSSKQ